MKDLKDTIFDENKDGYITVSPGVYKMHVCGFEKQEHGGRIVFNLTYKIADEVANSKFPKVEKIGSDYCSVKDDKGEDVMLPGSLLAGKEFRANGLWLTPSPEPKEGWRNRKYKNSVEILGVEFKTKGNKGEEVVVLAEIEEQDVLGKPCLGQLVENTFESKQTGEMVTTLQVDDIYEWLDGKNLDPAEFETDVPF